MGSIVTIFSLCLLDIMVCEVRLRNIYLVRLSTLIVYAGKIEEVTNFVFFTICVPLGRYFFEKKSAFLYSQSYL